MPRYCAVKLCKNRGGVLSKDNKRISFYPFPLRDQARLQKWVDNMKRQEWTPSRHQYLCSEHFTEDSFDLRWGIRYLKHTAIPTIFPYICEDENNRIQNRKNSKVKGRTCGTNVQLIRSLSPPRKKPLILKDNDFNNNNSDSVTSPTAVEVRAVDGQVFSVVLMGQLKLEAAVCPQEDGKSETGSHLTQTDSFAPVCISSCEPSLGGLMVDCSDTQVKEETEKPVCAGPAVTALPHDPSTSFTDCSEPSLGGLMVDCSDTQLKEETEEPVCAGPAVTALPHDPSASFTNCTSGMDMTMTTTTTTTTASAVVVDLGVDSLQTGLSHGSIAVTPVMCLQTGDKQDRGKLIAIEAPRETQVEGGPDKDEVEVELETEGEGEGEHACLCEHSYSRQDLDHEQLWSRIAALHAKITELDQREEETLAKIQVTEAELAQLRKQNIVCEEKQKALEEYFTSVFLQ